MWSLATFADDVTIPLTTTQQESAANSGIGRDERSLSFAPEASHDGRQSQVCADLIPPTGMGNFFAAHRFRKNQTKVLHI